MFDQDYSGNTDKAENQAQSIREDAAHAQESTVYAQEDTVHAQESADDAGENGENAVPVRENEKADESGEGQQSGYTRQSSAAQQSNTAQQNAAQQSVWNSGGQSNGSGQGGAYQQYAGWQNGASRQASGAWQGSVRQDGAAQNAGAQQGNGSWQGGGFQNGGAQNGGTQNAGGWQNGNAGQYNGYTGAWQGGAGQYTGNSGAWQGNAAQNTAQGTGAQNGHGAYSGRDAYGGQNAWQSRQGNYQYGAGNGGYGAEPGRKQKEKRQKERKPGKPGNPFWKKALAVLVSAVCFGVIAGVSFLAVVSLGGYQDETVSVTVPAVSEDQSAEAQAPDSQNGVSVTQGTTSMVVTDVTEMVERVMPAIVAITNESVTSIESFWGQTYEQQQESAGSGIIIGQNDDELLIVTNNHVVADATQLYVSFIDNSIVEALVKGTSPSMDLAVVAVKLEDVESDTRDAIAIAEIGDSDSLKVGEPVVAIGNALGYGQSVTTGVVSALNRVLEVDETGTSNAMIQTDAAINPGNSGGALLDINGQVIGINSNKIGGNAIEGMGYAIPISSAQPVIEQLMNQETREALDEANRGYLGISCINVTSAMAQAYGMPEGIYVAQVYAGTGAESAGIVKGDIITGINGMTVTTQDDLLNAMQYYAIGETIEITVMHGNPTEGYTEETRTVTLTSQEAMNASE